MLAFALLALAPVPGQCADPDESTDAGLRMLSSGEPCARKVPFPKIKGPATPALKLAVRKYFEPILLDATSARWKWGRVVGDGAIFCGYVNAKNRLGAYTGYDLFAVSLFKGKVVEHRMGSAAVSTCSSYYPDQP